MLEIVSLRSLAGDFAVLGRAADLADWEEKRGQDKGERCAQPSTLGRFLVSQGVRGEAREVHKNSARCVTVPKPLQRPVSCTSRRQFS